MRVRNLAGRLNARSAEELSRIAGFWQIPVSGRDRHSTVGQLYREMRDIRTARDVWERLTPDEQEVVQMLALSDRSADLSVTIAELASAIERDPDEARAIATSLYREGIVAREGDDDELPIGELPRIFLPRELAAVFRRIQDEIDAGDLSATPLPALLALLDDAEVDRAAELWGIDVVPGLRSREDVIEQFLTATGNESARAQVTRSLSADAKRLWGWLQEQSPPAPAELSRVYDAVNLEGDTPAAAQRRRDSLAELEERLLVMHTYRPDASRWVFIPADIGQPKQRAARFAGPPASVDERQVTPGEWQHPFATPWDLLSMVRAIQLPGMPRIRSFDDAPAQWLADLNRNLWNAAPGSDEPPAGYLAFLAALARNEGAIEGGESESNEPMTLGRAWRRWRSRTFVDQLGRLLWWWTSSAEWIEGQERGDVFVEHAEWPQFRRKLLVLLATLEQGKWYRLGQITRWVITLDPDILGAGARVATAGAPSTDRDDAEEVAEAAAEVVAEELRSAFCWFGLIELGALDDKTEVFRTTERLRLLEASQPPADVSPVPGQPLFVSGELEIDLRAPSPVRVWALSAFADSVELLPEPRYQLTSSSLERAMSAGSNVQDVIRFLETQLGEELPPAARETLDAWAAAFRRVRLRPALLIEPDDGRSRESIARLVREAGWDVEFAEEGLKVVLTDPSVLPQVMSRMAELLAAEGYTAQQERPPSALAADGQSDGG